MYEQIHTEEREGFEIEFAAAPEDLSPRGEFMTEDGSDDEETIAKIQSGDYAWFVARVTASKAGVVLGTDYLGACCYDNPSDFVEQSGYYEDLVAEAISQARAKLAELAS